MVKEEEEDGGKNDIGVAVRHYSAADRRLESGED